MARRLLLSASATAAVALLLALALLVPLAPPGLAKPRQAEAPRITPTPQELEVTGSGDPVRGVVDLIVGEEVDAATLAEVEEALSRAGVRSIRRHGPDWRPRGAFIVTIGEPAETPAVTAALDRLGVDGPQGLPADGYVLASGRSHTSTEIVLAGVDGDGTFYAAKTLAQLLDPADYEGPGRQRLPFVTIRDWPSMTLRGAIEGFYGTPWSHEQRLRQMDFYGDMKMNVYAYAPKDDPYHRELWDVPYPPEELARLGELVDRARRNHVDFIFALSPGLSICYSSEEDLQLLLDKFEAVYDLGVRQFNIALDDINYTQWHCPEDPAMFGTGAGGAGRAQAHLLNRVVEEFIETHPDVGRLQMVPTEYYNTAESAYKQALRTQLDPSVIVEWTGTAVVPATITRAQAAAARQVFGHDVFVWDNYPVNDYAPGQLLLGPYNGREAGLSEHLYGIHANPMNQAEASKIALATVADYVWNDRAYDPQGSLAAALDYLAGGDDEVADALAWFVDLNYTSILNPGNAPRLAALIDAFWAEHDAGEDGQATAALRAALAEIAAAPDVIREGLADNPIFLDEVDVWLRAQEHWAEAVSAGVDLLTAQAAGDGETAWLARREMLAARDAARALRDDTLPHRNAAPQVGTGVVDVFVSQALERSDAWLGVSGARVTPMTNLPTYQDNVPERMLDGDLDTFFWSSRAVRTGDTVGVDLGAVREITRVSVAMAKATSPRDFMQHAVLEVSRDGTTWTQLGSFDEQPEISVDAPAGTEARFVRLRATANQSEWLVVREFTVEVVGGVTTTVSGAPPAAAQSSLQAAADGDPESVYRAARAPQAGEALTVAYSAARPLNGVVVLTEPGSGTAATVEVRRGGTWEAIGTLDGAYTELPASGDVDGIRLVWAAGSPAPAVAEVIGWFTEPPQVAVDVDEVVVEAGGEPTTVTVSAVVGTLLPQTGTITVTVPDGWSADPASTTVTLGRGRTVTVPVAVTAPDGAAPQGDVTVTLSVGGETATTTVPGRLVPPVSDTNIALTGTATASSVEQDLPQFAPEFAIDGDRTTRWASHYDDGAWLQVELAEPARVGKVVLDWEAACGKAYEIQVSSDGSTWTTVASVSDGLCQRTELRFDSGGPVSFVRMQGITRATQWGYSLWELEIYPVREAAA